MRRVVTWRAVREAQPTIEHRSPSADSDL